jgi:hypothetical protein
MTTFCAAVIQLSDLPDVLAHRQVVHGLATEPRDLHGTRRVHGRDRDRDVHDLGQLSDAELAVDGRRELRRQVDVQTLQRLEAAQRKVTL